LCDVLIVDDQEIVRMVLVGMLEDEGLRVKEAASSNEAFSVAQEPSDCALLLTNMDLGVPESNGFEGHCCVNQAEGARLPFAL
jgi:CheY-like chemotaxis protein